MNEVTLRRYDEVINLIVEIWTMCVDKKTIKDFILIEFDFQR